MNNLSRVLGKTLEPLARRLRLIASRAVLSLISDGEALQTVQASLLADETRDGVERFQRYGLSSVPLPGCEAIFISLGGDRDHGVIVADDDRRYRPSSLAMGEVVVYTHEDAGGAHRIHLKNGNEIHLIAGGSSIVLTPDSISLNATNINVTGGTLTVKVGQTTVQTALSFAGPGGGAGTCGIVADVTHTGGSITSLGKRIDGTHGHVGVTPGDGVTGVPI
jgi:phage baseplate assembly protein V